MTQAAPRLADDSALPDDAVEVGRVLGAWGIKGWIRVQPFSRDPEALLSSKRWFVKPPENPNAGLGPRSVGVTWPSTLNLTLSKVHGDSVVAATQELGNRNLAEAMQGARIFVSRTAFPKVGDGEFYWIDLIGLAVVNRDGQALGTVIDLIDTGAHSVLRMRRPDAPDDATLDQAERLIPFVANFIDKVSLADRLITVDWGLDY